MSTAIYKNTVIIKNKEGFVIGKLVFKTLQRATEFIDWKG